jgi:hypothetical protein
MRILIVRLTSLGDVVHAIPAAAAIRRARPGAHIDGLVEAKHREIVDLVTVVDRVVPLAGSTPAAWVQAVRDLRTVRYDMALDFQGLMKSAVLARASGAAHVAGFSLWHLREKTARPFYSSAEKAEGGHAIRKNLRLLRRLGIDDDEQIEFPLAPFESPVVAALRAAIGGGRFALINPRRGMAQQALAPRTLRRGRGVRARRVWPDAGGDVGPWGRGARRRGRERLERRGGAVAGNVGAGSRRDVPRRRRGGGGGYRPAAHRHRGRHADGQPLRAHVSGTQRSLVGG